VPELPEVETIRRQLEPEVRGRSITGTRVTDGLLVAPMTPARFAGKLKGRMITGLSRRGKYLRFELDGGDTLVVHLRMTGILTRLEENPRNGDQRHLRLVLTLDDGSFLAFHDVRRFGKAFLLGAGASDSYWARLGPEPLERSFNPKVLAAIFHGRVRPVKPALLDQQLIAGIGNIYADEALFAALIHPEKPAGSLSGKEIAALTKSIKETLRRAIRLQGSSIDSYRDARGNPGRFQNTFKVHRRAGEPCPRCGTAIEKTRVGGRGTYYCPRCQRK